MNQAERKKLESKLDGRQKRAAWLCVEREFAREEDRITFDQIADAVGVSRNTLYEWRTKNRAFIDYMNSLADDILAGYRAHVYRQLLRAIDGRQPSIKAIDLYFRRHGLITDRQVIETKESVAQTEEDIAKEIAELDDMLSEDNGE